MVEKDAFNCDLIHAHLSLLFLNHFLPLHCSLSLLLLDLLVFDPLTYLHLLFYQILRLHKRVDELLFLLLFLLSAPVLLHDIHFLEIFLLVYDLLLLFN